MSKKILIIGGHGKVALLAAPLLTRSGHAVTGVIRNPDHAADVAATGATPLVADVESLDEDGLTALLDGVDVLVWSAGAGGGNPARTYAVDRDAAIRSVRAAERAGTPRYVMVSYFGAGPDHGISPHDPFFPYADAKTAADAALEASGLDYTILRPSRLTLDPPTGRIDTATSEPGEIPRGDVAAAIAAVVDAPESVTRAIITMNSGETPLGEALGA